ncbi:MAG: GNAT family N-acetyltransferase [Actinomycetota bacterium]
MVRLETGAVPTTEELVEFYDAVGWSAYTKDPEGLAEAVANSTYVAMLRDGERLIGLVRGLSDDVSVLYLQDIIVHPDYQGQGHGRRLIEHIVERFAHVRQKVLMTDDEERQHRLYESLGYRDVAEIDKLHAFARFDE